MATKTKSRRKAKKRASSKKPRYGTKAFYSMIGKKGARKAKRSKRKASTKRRSAGLRKVRRRFYPSFTYKRGPRRGRHYRPIVLHKYSKPAKRAGVKRPRRHPSVKWSGRKGTRLYTYKTSGRGKNRFGYFTNPRKGRRTYRKTRRNPSIAKLGSQYVGGLTGAPQAIMKTFQGRNAMRNTVYMALGGAAAYIGSGYLSRFVNPVLDKIGLSNPTAKRIVGAAMPYTAAFVATRFIKNRDVKTALMVGGALGSIVEFIAPGKIGQLVARIPGASQLAVQDAAASPTGTSGLHGPVAGLGGYVGAPSYQGVAGYVSAPSYQGAGDGMDGYVEAPGYQGVAGYVSAPGYQGAGDGMGNVEMLAGFSDDNLPVAQSSFLEQSFLNA